MKLPATRTRKIVFRSLIGILIFWALVLPLFTQERANESLNDIASNTSSQQQITQSQTPSADPVLPTMMEPVNSSQPQIIKKGAFRGINRQSAQGTASLVRVGETYFIRLEDDFSVSNGPDLFVALGNNQEVGLIVERLKANSGGQNYELPATFNPAQFNQVLIHCKAFAYSFGVADLN